MWYEDHSQYVIEDGLAERTWPASLGLVHVYRLENGDIVTTNGWREADFQENYEAGKFRPEGYLKRFRAGRPFGIIMRTVPYICIDIDGKNGGIQASKILMLPPTLAERSKSGDGYHLFYRLPEAEWDERLGYAEFPDALGIIPGVDIKATGVVYHYAQQRWNSLQIANLPLGVRRLMTAHRQEREARLKQATQLYEGEDAIIHADELCYELDTKELKEGGRNTWLFAWGCRAARYVRNWQELLGAKGIAAGLSMHECANIIQGVLKYGIGEAAVSENSENRVN